MLLRVAYLLVFASVTHGFALAHHTIRVRPTIVGRTLNPELAHNPASSKAVRASTPASAPNSKSRLSQLRRLLSHVRSVAVAIIFVFMLSVSAPSVAGASAVPTTTTMTTTQQRQAYRAYTSEREVPQPTVGHITDLAGYGLERSPGLANAIRDFEQRVKSPVYVVTLPSIGAPKSAVKNYATRLFNEWNIGSRGTQKGVLVLIVKDVRRVEVEVGKRLNSIVSHSWTPRMLANDVLPKLKSGAYASGVEIAIGRLAMRIEDGNSALPRDLYRSEDARTALAVGVGGCVLAIHAIASDRLDRTCDMCGSVIKQGVVKEDADSKLTGENFQMLGLDPLLSQSSKTTSITTNYHIGKWVTVQPATYGREGRRERVLRCHKCGAVSKKVRIIPRLVETSETSDNDGSSDGGGGGGGDF